MSLAEGRRLIGNAVPSALGEILGLQIRRQVLRDARVYDRLTLIPEVRNDQPASEQVEPVPREYLVRKKNWLPHPDLVLGQEPGFRAARQHRCLRTRASVEPVVLGESDDHQTD